ncbi:hypothetical protein Xsze_03677 [Xenorhabdus szentirmaii DSM 16338]|nr:hypothetical protein Xsze_03677 [Xenorhabdus szentirmaii DSM 16338]
MLWKTLTHIRCVQTLSFVRKGFDKSCNLEAELLHGIVLSLTEEEMTKHDIFFLNNQARLYLDNADEIKFRNYSSHKNDIKTLFSIVPEHLREKLEWNGPES